jgi:hypothetical protein
VLAPNAKLRKALIETAGPSGATIKLLTEARDKMEIDQPDPSQNKPQGRVRQAAARCWAMRLIAFIMEPPVVEKIWNRYAIPLAACIAYR